MQALQLPRKLDDASMDFGILHCGGAGNRVDWSRPLARLCQSCSCLIPLRRYRSSPIYEPRLRFFVRLPFHKEGLTSYFYSLSESMRHTSPSAPSARPSVCVQSHAEREGGRSAMAFDTMISLITAPLSPPKPFQLWPDPKKRAADDGLTCVASAK